MLIEKYPYSNASINKFSILIPTWNNLPYLKLCIESIYKFSTYNHQIIVHVNEGTDGTLEWLHQQQITCTYSNKNIGVCYALNAMRGLVSTDYILYLNDDMVVCPGWDKALYDEIKDIGHNMFFLSSTSIEPKAQSACSIQKNYGETIGSFNQEMLLKEYNALPFNDWSGSTWPPNIVHKDVWDLVGGYSIEFSPGMYSDPDFSMKLWQAGVRLFKGLSNSRVYHFGSISVKKVRKNKGYYRFINKWGITSSTLRKYYLHRGERFRGLLSPPKIPLKIKIKNIFKKYLALIKDNP